MASVNKTQQIIARRRLKLIIGSNPKRKLAIGRRLGYTGKDSSVIRNVNRLITSADSKQRRNIGNKKQYDYINTSYRRLARKGDVPDETINAVFMIQSGEKVNVTSWARDWVLAEDLVDRNLTIWKKPLTPNFQIEGIGRMRGIILALTSSGEAYIFRIPSFTNNEGVLYGADVNGTSFQEIGEKMNNAIIDFLQGERYKDIKLLAFNAKGFLELETQEDINIDSQLSRTNLGFVLISLQFKDGLGYTDRTGELT